MTDVARRDEAHAAVKSWSVAGRARIDDRPGRRCVLTIRSDGTWSALLAEFTFADQVDLLFVANDGGHFCGPAFVERSRADSEPFTMGTELRGIGPLLVAVPTDDQLELGDAELVDGEVVE